MKQISIYILLLFCIHTAMAQSDFEDIKKLNENYFNLKALDIDLSYTAYENHSTQAPLQTEKVKIQINDGRQWFLSGSIEILTTPDYYMAVNHKDKTVFISKIISGKKKKKNQEFIFNLEELLSICSSKNFAKKDANTNVYTLEFPSGEYEKIKIFYDPGKLLLKKTILYFRQAQQLVAGDDDNKQKPRLEIIYTNINTKPAFDQKTFTYSKYLYTKEKKLFLTNKYKNYQFIDQLSE